MKKFSKITTVILTVLLLCGLVLPLAASAAVDSGNNYDVSGNGANIHTDFTTAAPSSGAGSFNANTNNTSISRVRVLSADGTNYYQRHSWSGTNSAKAIEDTWFPGSQSVAVASGVVDDIGKCDYSIWDFDIGTDMYRFSYAVTVNNGSADSQGTLSMTVASQAEFEEYLEEFELYKADSNADIEKYPLMKKLAYTASGKTVKSIDSIDANQTLELAFLSSTNLGYTFRGYTYNADGTAWAASNKEVWGRVAKFVKQTDGWYLVDTQKADNKVKLVNEIGKFDHITYVFKIVKGTANSDGRTRLVVNLYTFINGEYFNTVTVSNNVYEQLLPQRLSFCYPKDSLLSYGWAIAADNFASNYYTNYDSTNANGIGALLASDSLQGKNLFEVNDVLYNNTYISPNGYVSVDGVKASVGIDTLLTKVKDNSVIETMFDIIGYELPDGVETLTVKLHGDSKFTLGPNSAEEFVIVRGANGVYTIRRGTESDFITLEWTYFSGSNKTVLKREKIAFDTLPVFKIDETFAPEIIELVENTEFDWKFDIDGNASNFGPLYDEGVNLYDPEPVRAITWIEILLIREELGAVLTVYSGEYVPEPAPSNQANLSQPANNESTILSDSNNTIEQNSSAEISKEVLNTENEAPAPIVNGDVTAPAAKEDTSSNSGTLSSMGNAANLNTNDESLSAESISANASESLMPSSAQSDSAATSYSWLIYVTSILTVAITVALLRKHRKEM